MIYRLCGDQREIDSRYDDMCRVIFSEMDKFLIYKESSGKKSGRRLKLHKPSWNDNLTLCRGGGGGGQGGTISNSYKK